jgi:hypothetical protein
MNGMLLYARAVVLSMCACSSDDTCGTPGFDVDATNDPIQSVALSDVACDGVTAECTAEDDAGTCARFYVSPIAAGNCHVDVFLLAGTTFSADVKVAAGPSSCSGFFPESPGDDVIEVP